MFRIVNRRVLRTLIYVVVTAQILLSAPIATALARSGATSHAAAHCAGMMPSPDDSKPCPCCPDGADMAACLSACTATAGAVTVFAISTAPLVFAVSRAPAFGREGALADPPLKPPPIA